MAFPFGKRTFFFKGGTKGILKEHLILDVIRTNVLWGRGIPRTSWDFLSILWKELILSLSFLSLWSSVIYPLRMNDPMLFFKQCKPQILVSRQIPFHITFHARADRVISCSKVSPAVTVLIALTKMCTEKTVTQQLGLPAGSSFQLFCGDGIASVMSMLVKGIFLLPLLSFHTSLSPAPTASGLYFYPPTPFRSR